MVRCPVCRDGSLVVTHRASWPRWREERYRCTSCDTRLSADALLLAKQHELEDRADRVGKRLPPAC